MAIDISHMNFFSGPGVSWFMIHMQPAIFSSQAFAGLSTLEVEVTGGRIKRRHLESLLLSPSCPPPPLRPFLSSFQGEDAPLPRQGRAWVGTVANETREQLVPAPK